VVWLLLLLLLKWMNEKRREECAAACAHSDSSFSRSPQNSVIHHHYHHYHRVTPFLQHMSDDPQSIVQETIKFLKHFKTAPYNSRFPNQNQTNYCWASYVQYFKCAKEKDEEDPECKKYKFYYIEMCPKGWVMRFCLRLFCSYFILFSFY
jgi:cytochrome c oxidase subunit 6b